MASESNRVTLSVGRHLDRAMRLVTIRSYQALTSASPVDTGFFRAGWSPSTGARIPGPPNQPASRETTKQKASALLGAHQRAADQISRSYKLAAGVVFIVNNVGYGIFLNRGTSAQAPRRFVQQAVRAAVVQTARELRPRRSR